MLRPVVAISTPGTLPTFPSIIDTGGPVTVIAQEILESADDARPLDDSILLHLGGASQRMQLWELTLELRPPRSHAGAEPISWWAVAAATSRFPHPHCAALLGHGSFFGACMVTLGAEEFVVEPADRFTQRFH
ncbi:MAG: hypothetical protein S0880_02405 [Actinomycetota bacterium]|nr:hypothetical protein [Actinomycetota bacterium]